MAYQYLLNIQLRGHPSTVEFEVRESHWLRAQDFFDNGASFYQPARFLTFDSVDGLVVAVSCADVQFVRFLYNAVKFPSDQKRKDDDVQVWLRGHDAPVSVRIDDEKDALSAFFIALDTGAEICQFPALIDEDGETVCFNADEIVLVTAPMHEVSEGHQELMRDDNSDRPRDAGGSGDLEGIPF